MKLKVNRKQKKALDLGAILAAATLTVSFLITACRKRSIRAALCAVLSAGCGAVCLAASGTGMARFKKHPDEEKLFSDEECRAAQAHVRRVRGGRHDEQIPPRVLRDIPRDEDATEDDFQ